MGNSAKPAETGLRAFRVFISSPGDVDNERSFAHLVLNRLQNESRYRERIAFRVVACDGPGVSVPMRFTETAQHSVSRSIGDPTDCEVAVIILWSRLGTPLPEKHVKEDGTPYRSGTEWELENALAAHRKYDKPEILVYRRPKQPPLYRKDPNYQESFAQQEAVDEFFDALREPGTRAILRGVNDYAEPNDFGSQLESHLRALVEEQLGEWLNRGAEASTPNCTEATSIALYDKPPFPGLRAFQESDAAVYFGRGAEIDALLELLRSPGPSLVLVVGASGSGKSSLVRAGLTPRLKNGAIEGSSHWLYAPALNPTDAEKRPFHALARAFGAFLDQADENALASRLRSDPASIVQLASEALNGEEGAQALLLVVDQLEELFAEQALADQVDSFLALLAAGAGHGGLRLVATVRADFFHHCLEHPRLGPIVQQRSFMLRAPGEANLREMIQGPARMAGVTLDAEVVSALVNDVCGRDGLPEPGALPLLAYALELLYERRDRVSRHICLSHYHGLGEGGAGAAIGARAKKVFDDLPGEARAAFGAVFRELVHVSEEGTATRRKAALGDLTWEPASAALIKALVAPEVRLLIADADRGETGAIVEVAHEALFKQWPRLRDWVAEYGGDLRLVRQLEAAARAWEAKPDDPLHQPWPHEAQVVAYSALTRLGRQWKTEPEPLHSFLRPEASRLLETISQIETPHWRRAEIGDRLARIGDSRPGVGLTKEGLPGIAWCRIPSGTVTLEDGAGTFKVESFDIARYPVSHRQYRAFIEAGDGYRDERWWQGLEHESEPGVPHRTTDNCPADRVSWYDAVAFCRWLSTRLRQNGQLAGSREIRLPTEWEWQRAATGGQDNREYPWGDWDERYANTSESRLDRTTAVGMYPHGAWAAEALLDMAGNVLEWCLNKYEEPQVTRADGSNDQRVLRGGSWDRDRRYARCSSRNVNHQGYRSHGIGFRVLCSSPID